MQSYTGMPQKGQGRARGLGFPTINIPLTDEVSGIFAANVSFGTKTYHAVAFADPRRHVLEAHIVESFSGEVTEEVTIVLEKKIRDSMYFPEDTMLREAIREDVAKVREYFKN